MAKNLYRVLEASEHASSETLTLLFEQKQARLQKELDSGNPSAKEHLWALKNAYETLSDPEKRTTHDRLWVAPWQSEQEGGDGGTDA